ncbi:MAG TPA: NIPSNAP family protein [Rhizomicrobium sp.]|nr:NIPSNAP family protein [Rhizomicrobium sp.]
MTACCPVVELRQYTLKPGQRDVLIALFEARFVESQEACGMTLIGQFRDLDDPDRFVWLRGFPDMESRARALAAFYGGPVWKAHREAANATMIDSGNVLLLRPGRGFDLAPRGGARPSGTLFAHVCRSDAAFAARFARDLAPHLDPLAWLVTEPARNTFPALPVREGENVLVWFGRSGPPSETGRPVESLRLEPTARSRLR